MFWNAWLFWNDFCSASLNSIIQRYHHRLSLFYLDLRQICPAEGPQKRKRNQRYRTRRRESRRRWCQSRSFPSRLTVVYWASSRRHIYVHHMFSDSIFRDFSELFIRRSSNSRTSVRYSVGTSTSCLHSKKIWQQSLSVNTFRAQDLKSFFRATKLIRSEWSDYDSRKLSRWSTAHERHFLSLAGEEDLLSFDRLIVHFKMKNDIDLKSETWTFCVRTLSEEEDLLDRRRFLHST